MSLFNSTRYLVGMTAFLKTNNFNEDFSDDGSPLPPPTEDLMITETGIFMITETLSQFMATE